LEILAVENIDVSVIVPTKNEEVTAKLFIDWCNQGFAQSNLKGEIIFLDSSNDRTPEIAIQNGARVISVSRPGLGFAYKQGQGQVRGKWVILGDADCTYDFRKISDFINALKGGHDFVMGNRFIGSIEKGAMPLHHQYFGSPSTSFIFRYSLGIPVGDIHCGMRALTRDLYNKLPFLEDGWEYAPEMIVSARNLGAKIVEIPINFLKEPKGRISHHKRSSWFSPFKAGWGTLRVVATYLIDRVFLIPGLFFLIGGTIFNFIFFFLPDFSLKFFNAGRFSQAIMLSFTLLGSFLFCSSILARFSYRRLNTSINRNFNKSKADKFFTTLILSALVEVVLSIYTISSWLLGLTSNSEIWNYNFRLISFWLAYSSVFCIILSFSTVYLIGFHVQKLNEHDSRRLSIDYGAES
jgi:glycosyltransferase involved in cell wall biosynthesis